MFYHLNNLLFKPAVRTIQGVGFFALSDLGIFTLALWAWLFHCCVFAALVAVDVVTELAKHWGVLC